MADIAGDLSTTAGLTVGGSTTNSIDFNGDHDWFAVNLVASQQVTVSVYGITLEDPYLNIRDSSGQIVASNDDISSSQNRNSAASFAPTSSGTYYVDVGAYNEAYSGTYQVSVQPGTTPPLATVDTLAAYLTIGYWNGTAHHFPVTQGGTITVNMTALNPAEQNLARTALSEWSDITGVHFQELASGGQIVFDNSADPSGNPVASTDAIWSSSGVESSAHIHISSSWVNRYGTGLDTYSFQTYIHEIGHALGLGHEGNYNDTATYSTDALFQNDAWSNSIMSYFDQRQNSYFANQGFSRDYVATPMVADIAAMQTLYGLSTTTRTGNTTYGYHSNAGGVYDASVYPNVAVTIFDSGGNDTLDYSGSSANQLINLNPETFSNVNGNVGNLNIGRGVVIENAIGGAGNDTIIGNGVANVITGGGGRDTLTGGGGKDTFQDTLAGLNGDTITDFRGGDKIDITDASLSGFTLSVSGTNLTINGSTVVHLGAAPTGTLTAIAAAGGGVQLAYGSEFSVSSPVLTAFGSAAGTGGWVSQDHYPRVLGDVNGDGLTDIIGFGNDGVYVSMALAGGGFATPNAATNAFGMATYAGGWSSNDQFPREVADINGDGRSDVVGFGQDGVYVAFGQTNGTFAAPHLVTTAFGASNSAGGWSSNDKYPRVLADVNGDGHMDIVGFGNDGAYVALGQAGGTFASPVAASSAFGYAAQAGGWASNDQHPRELADVNNDGRADIVGFGNNGVYVALGQANGTFAIPSLVLTQFGAAPAAGSWTSQDLAPRELADVNGDGKIDIVGFGQNGVYIALGNGDGTFHTGILDDTLFGSASSAGGWSTENAYPRLLADINHDGAADIVGFGPDGVHVAYSSGDIF